MRNSLNLASDVALLPMMLMDSSARGAFFRAKHRADQWRVAEFRLR
ncbi:hypothetical protein DEA8626_04035 [Defluviimonas aquaemixtae]|uniref:Uncharacterized protein n=1 Tax=Albidovulum aquaemixtae TaxID=1542388 RepID=A0A2R8BNI4_9RHOB|nr:hypothetical protein DEA8626_04035 [Defluviimonas aquaemixtae]